MKRGDVLEKAGFKCQKCGFYSPIGKDLEVFLDKVLCNVCSQFAPSSSGDLSFYLNEKVNWQVLDPFRKYVKTDNQKQGMIHKAKAGRIMSRPAFGYNMVSGELIPAQNADEIREIFEAFSAGKSLNQLSREHNLSVNGIKKILKNFTYIGKVKFDSKILQGKHQPIISTELFNRVQQKFEVKK